MNSRHTSRANPETVAAAAAAKRICRTVSISAIGVTSLLRDAPPALGLRRHARHSTIRRGETAGSSAFFTASTRF